ncbi:MAG: hypothetical protein BM557_08570 [Flavobacterium sp. MedPE-SWcel]|uniref:hypothetical protein n=1 Tax=uncultured Flavobacterium sp. TaxID=165435 RepID=UPI000921D866|nr:hypothetical protein [uncultured Flavobacterium sp.]OIQ17257.1 MAG: hypothetical protein BM557_08570 [Flavobacterium sp. MedPE-SWcel]
MRKIYLYILLVFAISCNEKSGQTDNEISEKINSSNTNQIVTGYYYIGEEEKTKFIPNIFENPTDARISHSMEYKGISVYQSKMIAMKKISGLPAPNSINSTPDSLVIKFYYDWAIKNNYIKK